MTLAQVTSVFGWMTVINIVIYMLAAAFIIFGRNWLVELQSRMMGVPVEDWPRLYVDYLSRYKIALLMFNVVPYIALLLVS